MITVWIIILLIVAIYGVLILYFLYGWLKIPEFKENISAPAFRISVIIPFRNESENIENLVKSLINQELSREYFEVIFINDHSEDDSAGKISNLIREITNFRLIYLEEDSGKKHAIRLGIMNSAGELIVATDADCRFGPRWLSSIAAFYQKTGAQLISGPVMMNQSGFFSSFQSLDFLSLISSGAGAVGNRTPVMCNGANLIFRKSAYLEVANELNSKYVSGDDIFLMNQINGKYPGSVHFLKSKDALVTTNAEKTFKLFINQRLRWASKTTGVKNSFYLLTAIVVLLMNLSVILSLTAFFFIPDQYILFLLPLVAKTIFDFVFLIFPAVFFNKSGLTFLIFPYQVIYCFYIAFTGIMANFVSFRWKKRISGKTTD